MQNKSSIIIDSFIQGIVSKYEEIKENTLFEVMQIADSFTLADLKEKGYEMKMITEGTKCTISLWYQDKHIITYIIYFDHEEFKIKRDRLINNLEGDEGNVSC